MGPGPSPRAARATVERSERGRSKRERLGNGSIGEALSGALRGASERGRGGLPAGPGCPPGQGPAGETRRGPGSAARSFRGSAGGQPQHQRGLSPTKLHPCASSSTWTAPRPTWATSLSSSSASLRATTSLIKAAQGTPLPRPSPSHQALISTSTPATHPAQGRHSCPPPRP